MTFHENITLSLYRGALKDILKTSQPLISLTTQPQRVNSLDLHPLQLSHIFSKSLYPMR